MSAPPAVQAQPINFEELDDVASFVTISYQNTRFDRRTGRLVTDASVTNVSPDQTVEAPLLLVVTSINAPGVSVANADGVTPDGKPYFDFSGVIGDDNKLTPSETSALHRLEFVNPARRPFGFEGSCLGVVPLGVLSIKIEAPENLSVTAAATVDVSGRFTGSPVAVEVNGLPAVVDGKTFSLPALALVPGTNTVHAVARHADGTIVSDTVRLVRDNTAPVVVISSPKPDTVVYADRITVTGAINDPIKGLINDAEPRCEVNGIVVPVSNGAFSAADVPLAPGNNNVVARATDEVGNVGETTVRVRYDDTAVKKILVDSGNNQSAGTLEPLPADLVAKVVDEAGNPVRDRAVVFRVTQNNGFFASNSKRVVAVNSDVNGLAAARLITGTRTGEGCNRVEATAAGFEGKAVFVATSIGGPPVQINVSMGAVQKGVVNSPLPEPLGIVIFDAGNNCVSGIPIEFKVIEGGGKFVESDAGTFVVNTDVAGRAAANLVLGPDAGIENNVVEARIVGVDTIPATFVASGVTAGNPADTTFSGVVLDNADQPIPGVTMSVHNTLISTRSDEQGQFLLTDVPVGPIRLNADGSTATRPGNWPHLAFDVVTIAGVENTLGMPVYLLPIVDGPVVGGDVPVDIFLDNVPGFKMTVLPHSTTFGGVHRPGNVSVTQVHSDKVPMTPSDGLQPTIVITIQPPDVHLDPPAPICYPNSERLTPGQMTNMYSFDHDLGRFVDIGPGTVTEDGAQICSDPGFGIVKGGWHCAGPSNPSGGAASAQCTITSGKDKVVCVGEEITFTATGSPTPGKMTWSGGEMPATGEGLTFKTKFTTPGTKTVTAKWTCESGESDTDDAVVSIVKVQSVAVHASDTNTHKIASAMVNGKEHFVCARNTGDIILQAMISPDNEKTRMALVWEADGAGITSPAVGDDKRTAKLSSADAKKIPVRIKIDGKTCWEGFVWVVWANLATTSTSGPTQTFVGTVPANVTTQVGAEVHWRATIQPAAIITDADRPDLSGANTTNPPGAGTNTLGGLDLAGGATQKWDISRRVRQSYRINGAPVNVAGIRATVAYPGDDRIGNDDGHAGDEDDDPYNAPDAGSLTSVDTPVCSFVPGEQNVGDTLELRIHFGEFARLELDGNWYRISDFANWRLHIALVKHTDQQLLAFGAMGAANANAVGPGADAVLDSAIPQFAAIIGGDDMIAGGFVTSGANGTVESRAVQNVWVENAPPGHAFDLTNDGF